MLKFLQRAMPVALTCWAIDFVAREWGIFGVLFLCLGVGALLGLILAVHEGLNPFQAFALAKVGLLPGFLAWVVIAPVLGLLGYEMETAPRKAREAALSAVASAMHEPGDVPFDRLRPGVEELLDRLPNHPLDRPDAIAGLAKFLDDPDPLVRSQAMLALGRFEGYADRLMPTFDAGLKSGEPRLRAAALISLTGMRPFTPEMLSRVIPMLADTDADVRMAAAEAVRRIDPLLKEGEKEQLRAAAERAAPTLQESSEGR